MLYIFQAAEEATKIKMEMENKTKALEEKESALKQVFFSLCFINLLLSSIVKVKK